MTSQLGFAFEAAAPLPVTRDIPADPLSCYRELIEQHHAAMMAGDVERTLRIREQAHDLATDMNGGTNCGIIGPDGPGTMLENQTAAKDGEIPLWGQLGNFVVAVGETRVLIEQDGIFGIGAAFSFWPGFAVHIVDLDKPFPISGTGYRTFISDVGQFAPAPNTTPDAFACEVLAAYLASQPKPKTRKRRKDTTL